MSLLKRSSCVFVGIDPGSASGAIAIVLGNEVAAEDCYGTPADIWNQMQHSLDLRQHPNVFAAVEKVSAMPKQGVTGMFRFGENFGAWQMLFLALKIPYELVRPQQWQKEILASAGVKHDGPLEFCRRRFPELHWGRKKDHNRASALCIALWARERMRITS